MNLIRYWHTLIRLTPRQLFFQLRFRAESGLRRKPERKLPEQKCVQGFPVGLLPDIPKRPCRRGNRFRFLNVTDEFQDWNDVRHGKLWAYHLNYMDWLLQPDADFGTGWLWIERFIAHFRDGSVGSEAYPLSLRIVNWIRFLSRHADRLTKRQKEAADASLYGQCRMLSRRIEYRLGGNHLLENGFALLWGGVYFRNGAWSQKGVRILVRELRTQILADGGHFEQCPAYHALMLERILDAVNLLRNNPFTETESFLALLPDIASRMLGWLKAVAWTDGTLPPFNDSVPEAFPSLDELTAYAERLGIAPKTILLGASGYRKYESPFYECLTDIGGFTARHNPGHSHADTLGFLVRLPSGPFVVETGVSTYEKNARRQYERGTAAHNTVTVGNRDSSEVWGGFRVGRRARVTVLTDTFWELAATHDGYERLFGAVHERTFRFEENRITIVDRVPGKRKNLLPVARLHLQTEQGVLYADRFVCDKATVTWRGAEEAATETVRIAAGFNRFRKATRLVLTFRKELETVIVFHPTEKNTSQP